MGDKTLSIPLLSIHPSAYSSLMHLFIHHYPTQVCLSLFLSLYIPILSNLSIYPPNHPTYTFMYIPILLINISIYLSIHLPIYPTTHLLNHSSIYPYIYPTTHLPIHPSTQLTIYLPNYLFTYLSIDVSNYLFTHPFTYLTIY